MVQATHDERLRYIDSDGHILEPPTELPEFAPVAFRDRIWHIETDSAGAEWVICNDRRIPGSVIAVAGAAGFSDEDVERVRTGAIPYTEVRPSGWTPRLRLADLDGDGIELSVLYPTALLGLQSERDVEFGRVQARAYNDWCSQHLAAGEGRLFGAGALPPMHEAADVQAVVDEIYRIAGLAHMVSVFMRPNPAIDWRPLNDPVYDAIWRAAQETGLPIAFHPFLAPDLPGACLGLKLARPRQPDGAYVALDEMDRLAKESEKSVFLPNLYFTQAIANPTDVMCAICYVTAGGVCERFPGAHFIFLEANGGWLVPWLERLDHQARKIPWDLPGLSMLPSEYFRRQCWISFDPDESMLDVTARSPLCGADRIIWASDYPHLDAKFPGVTLELAKALQGLPKAEQQAIASESAIALYGIGAN